MTHEPHHCTATTRSGNPCRFMARRHTRLCVNHDPEYRDQQVANLRNATQASLAARRQALPVLEDLDLSTRAGVQAALEAIVRLEIDGKLSHPRFRALTRALGIAARNFDPLAPGQHHAGHPYPTYTRLRTTLARYLDDLQSSGALPEPPQ